MASNFIKVILPVLAFFSSQCISDDTVRVYRFENIYSDIKKHGKFKTYNIKLSSNGFESIKKTIQKKATNKHNDSHCIINNYNSDPLVGIALESSFLLDLYRLTDRFVIQSERDRVRNEVARRINELHSRW